MSIPSSARVLGLCCLLSISGLSSGDEHRVRQELRSLRAAIDDLAASFPDRYAAEEFRSRWNALNRKSFDQRSRWWAKETCGHGRHRWKIPRNPETRR